MHVSRRGLSTRDCAGVRYTEQLQQRFPGLDPRTDDLFLLEDHQIASLPDRAPRRALAAVVRADPRLHRFLVARHPPIRALLAQLLAEYGPAADAELMAYEQELVWEIADWIVYQRAPDRYDEGSEFDRSLTAISDVVTLDESVVVDAGAGTGEMAIEVARRARHVFAVEPVAALRSYIRERAAQERLDNVFVLDGTLDTIPLPPRTADVLLTRQAIGWRLDAELLEVGRVVKPDGIAVHLSGMPHPAPPDDDLHRRLLADGYEPDTYRERAVRKRRYRKRSLPDSRQPRGPEP